MKVKIARIKKLIEIIRRKKSFFLARERWISARLWLVRKSVRIVKSGRVATTM